jgi:hypothetical protein
MIFDFLNHRDTEAQSFGGFGDFSWGLDWEN